MLVPRPHGTVDRLVVVLAFVGFAIAAEIKPGKPSAVASCDDLANFVSHRVSSLVRNRGTLLAHWQDLEARIGRLVRTGMDDRPSADRGINCRQVGRACQ